MKTQLAGLLLCLFALGACEMQMSAAPRTTTIPEPEPNCASQPRFTAIEVAMFEFNGTSRSLKTVYVALDDNGHPWRWRNVGKRSCWVPMVNPEK